MIVVCVMLVLSEILMSTLFPFLEAAMSVPKKRKNMKELKKKEAIGNLLDAFTEVCISPDYSMKD